MARFRVVERIFREHYVEAETAEAAKREVKNGLVDGGEDYDWEVVDVEEVGEAE